MSNPKRQLRMDIDRYICDRYLSQSEYRIAPNEELAPDLNLCGLYSYIYGDNTIFESYFDDCIPPDLSASDLLKNAVASDTGDIVGLGLGILQTHFPNKD